jgi:hypothetical protein
VPVVVPPRGQGQPRLGLPPAAHAVPLRAAPEPAPAPARETLSGGNALGLSAAPLAIVPLIAGALLGGTLAGSGGSGTSGPARTR